MSAIESFRAAMRAAGLEYAGPIAADEKIHRFKAGDDRERTSWFVLFPGPPTAGAFGCWKRNFKEKWCEKRREKLNDAEWKRLRESWQRADAERERTEAERHAKARKVAAWLMKKAKAPQRHAYLERKGVKAFGDVREQGGKLRLPLRDASGELHSLQSIDADGAKRFLTGGRVAGCFFTVSDTADGPLVIAEGYATAASVHEATGFATVAAMNCGNLLAVAKALRDRWPHRVVIICADDDRQTHGNPGVTKATEAAKAIGTKMAIPRFMAAAIKETDFNDLAASEGLDTVKTQIEAATQPKETDAEAYARLAKLDAADYDRARDAEAKRLGIRAPTLDKEVAALRPKANSNVQGFAVELPDVEPWPDAVNGPDVLRDVSTMFTRYVFLPHGAAHALALWTAHAHCFEAFLHSPRLNLRSAEKGCGKTTLLDVLASLVPRPMRTESMTSAVLFRVIDRHRPTLLLDETDAYLDENEELRGLLNAGHRRGARALRVEGENLEVRAFNAFAPAVLAGIGGLTGKLSTLHDRSVVVDLVRARPGEIAERFDSRRTAYETELCRKLARWTADNFDRLQISDPTLPAGAFNRLADNWRCLFAIAEAAGEDWPRRAAAAFAALTSRDDVDSQGIGAMLLGDIAAIFAAAGVDKLPSAILADELAAIEGRPWHEYSKSQKPITANQVAKLLRRFNVGPHSVRDGKEVWKGYELADFTEAFARFLPQTPIPNGYTVTLLANKGENGLFEPLQPESVLPLENSIPANKDGTCNRVTAGNTVAARETEESERELASADLL